MTEYSFGFLKIKYLTRPGGFAAARAQTPLNMKKDQIQRKLVEYRIIGKRTNVEQIQVKDSKDAYDFIMNEVMDKDTLLVSEAFFALYIDAGNHIKGFAKISDGGVTNVIADPRIVFVHALNCLAAEIIVTHNHPSGNTRPSTDDKILTKRLTQAGEFLHVRLKDHIICGEDSYYSFLDHGDIL